MSQENRLLIILAFAAIYIIWGTTYLAIAFGLQGFPPFLLSMFRFTIAGILLTGWCRFRRLPFPRGRRLFLTVIGGVIMLIGGSGLVTLGEKYIPSGQAAVIIATEPFFFLLFDRKKWSYYLSRPSVIFGLVLGFVGILLFFVLSGNLRQGHINGYLILFVSCILWVVGSLLSKSQHHPSASNTSTTALQLLAAGIVSGFIGLLVRETRTFSFASVPSNAWWGLIYLITMGSLVAYLSFTWLLTVRPPALVSTHTYVNPVVAVLFGWWMLGESMSRWQMAGLVIILLGVYLTTKKPATRAVAMTGAALE